ncbi:hypothetical protein LJC39_01860 [Parabacteroides sp. OttesenSCG-928-B22]|nr:hypothetical protein [Parabacteroides sp. OttesenSCG-928-B22]
MDNTPVYVTFEFNGNLGEEVEKVTLSIKGMRDESANTFKNILQSSNEAFTAMSNGNQALAKSIQEDIESLRQLKAIQEAMNEAREKGTMSSSAYLEQTTQLSIQEKDLRDNIAVQIKQLNESIEAEKRQVGSMEEKRAVIASLEQAYLKLSEAERNGDQGEKLLTQIKELKSELRGLEDSYTAATSSSADFMESAQSLPGPLGSAAGGINKVTAAAKKFIATPLGAILAAIAAALALVTAWFRRTEDGQNALAVATATFNQVLNSLLDLASKAGEWLWKAFTKPKEALADLRDFIDSQINNRLTGLAKAGEAIAKIFQSGFKEGWAELGNAVLQIGTGIEDAGQKALSFISDVKTKSEEAAALAHRSNELEKQQRNFLVERAKMEARINELRDTGSDMSVSEKERLAAIKEAMRLNDEMYSQEIRFAKEKHAIIKANNALADSNKQDLLAEAEALADVHRLDAQRLASRRMMLRTSGTLSNKVAKEESQTAIDILKDELGKKKELYALYYSFVENQGKEAGNKAYADLVKEGESYREYLLREIAKLESLTNRSGEDNNMLAFLYQEKNALSGQKTAADLIKEEIDKLKQLYGNDLVKLRNELLKLQQSFSGDQSENGVQKSTIINEALASVNQDTEKKFQELMLIYGEGYEKIGKITEEYQNDIALIRGRITEKSTEEEKKQIESAVEERTEAYKKALLKESELLDVFLGDGSGYINKKIKEALPLFRDLSKATANELKKIKEVIEDIEIDDDLLRKLEEAGVDVEKLRAELEKVKTASSEAVDERAWTNILNLVGKISDAIGSIGSAFQEMGGSLGDAGAALSGFAENFDNIATSFGSASKEDKISAGIQGVVALVGMVTSAYKKRKEAEKDFYRNSIAMAHEYSLALNEQLRLQSELSESGFVTDYAGRLNDGFNALSDAAEKYQEAISKLADGKAKVDLRNSIDWGNVGKGIGAGAAVGAAIGSVVPVIGNAIGAVVGGLVGGLVGLFGGKKKKNEYGGLLEVFPELVDAAGNLNKELAETLINTDQVNEDTKQLIQNALDWADAVEEANKQIKDITVELAGALGDDLKTAMIEAWKAGEDASKSMFDAASRSLENFIENLLYSTIFSDVFNTFGDKLAESLSHNGDGDILDDYDWLMNQMDERDDAFLELLDQFKKRAKERGYDMWQGLEEAANITGSSKGLAAMSQNSADELNGRFTTMLIYQDKINANVFNINELLQSGISHLKDIAENTAHCKKLVDIEKSMSSVEKSMEAIKRDGLYLKR